MVAEGTPRAAFALLVGIGNYLHADRIDPLPYAARDARSLEKLFTDPDVCGFPREQVDLLVGKNARREAIVQRLSQWLPQRARGAEIVVLYFAGHGMVHPNGPS